MILDLYETGARPAGKPNECFYCHVDIPDTGDPQSVIHTPDCVIPTRTVVVETTFTWVKEVPMYWDIDSIEFQMNDSSSCASNLLDDIVKQVGDDCPCHRTNSKYIREATEQDHEGYGYK
jgi:hypothetical protein